jgi:hypothetical protein
MLRQAAAIAADLLLLFFLVSVARTAFSNRGGACNVMSAHDRALEDYDTAIRLNPANAVAFFQSRPRLLSWRPV